MIVQEVIERIIQNVEQTMSNKLSTSFKGKGAAIQMPSGKVVSVEADRHGNREYLGIQDNIDNYFYIRYIGTPTARKLQGGERRGSCNSRIITAPLRLVLQKHCKDPQPLLLLTQFALFSTAFTGKRWNYGVKKAELNDRAFSFISWDIWNQETLKSKTDYKSSSLQLISIDFDLVINTSYKNCKDLKIC